MTFAEVSEQLKRCLKEPDKTTVRKDENKDLCASFSIITLKCGKPKTNVGFTNCGAWHHEPRYVNTKNYMIGQSDECK